MTQPLLHLYRGNIRFDERNIMVGKSQNVRIAGIGKILMERSRRAKHICLSVRPFRGVRVAVPYGVPFSRARTFARRKAEWIRRQQQKVARIEKQAAALTRLGPIRRAEARKRLLERLATLAAQHGFSYNRVYVRSQKTRWGSCSDQNNISLNMNLVRLPDELIDYTILHELVHTRVKSHSTHFWQQLDALVGDARALDRQLRPYHVLLLSAWLKDHMPNR